MKKAILVTGSNGEIGSQLLASMQDNPIIKIALDINESITNYDNTIYSSQGTFFVVVALLRVLKTVNDISHDILLARKPETRK